MDTPTAGTATTSSACSYCKSTVQAEQKACPTCGYPEHGSVQEQNTFKQRLKQMIMQRDDARHDLDAGRRNLGIRTVLLWIGVVVEVLWSISSISDLRYADENVRIVTLVVLGFVLILEFAMVVVYTVCYYQLSLRRPRMAYTLVFVMEGIWAFFRLIGMLGGGPFLIGGVIGFVLAIVFVRSFIKAYKAAKTLPELEERLDFYRSVRGVETSTGL